MPKLNLAKAKALGFTDSQIQSYLAKNPNLGVVGGNEAPVAPEKSGGITDWLPTAGSVLGGVLGAPLGGVGAIGGAAIGGGAGEFLRQTISGEQSDIGKIGKEAALGGAGGAVGKVAGTAFKGARALVGGAKPAAQAAASAEENILERMGQSMRKGVIKPKVNPSATAFDEEADLLKGAKDLGLSGPAENMRRQSAVEYKRLIGDMQSKLAVNNPPLDPKISSQTVKQAIEGTLNFDGKSDLWKRVVKLRSGQISEKKNVQELLKYKLDLGGKLGRAFKKIELGNDLTVQEEAGIATWQSIDRIIAQVAPELKDLTTQMSVLHKLAPGLAQSSRQGVSVGPLGKIPGVTPAIQGAQDAAGRLFEKAGGAMGKGINIPGGQVVGQTAAQVGTRAALDQKPSSADSLGTEFDTTNQGTLADFSDEEKKQKLIKQAFTMQMLANPKQAATLKAIYDFGFAGDANATIGKVSAKDYATAKSGLKNLQDVRKIYEDDPNVLTKQLVPGKFVSRKFDTAMYDVADTLLRLRTGAQANESEVRGYMKTIGLSFGDSPKVVQYKLNKLESDLKAYLHGGTGTSLSDFGSENSADSLDQF